MGVLQKILKIFKSNKSKSDLFEINKQDKEFSRDSEESYTEQKMVMSEEEKERLIDQKAKDIAKNRVYYDDDYVYDFDPYEYDELFEEAARIIVQNQHGSTSLLQRKLKLGYNRAGRIIDQLEAAGIVGHFEGSKAREVKIATEFALEQFLKDLPLPIPLPIHENQEDKNMSKYYEENEEEIELRVAKYQLEEMERKEKDEIKQKLLYEERKKRIHKEALQELIEEGEIFNQRTNNEGEREPIPQDVMDKIWNRDGGKCVRCGGQENLEFDHIIPVSKGGATSYRNLQLLCKKCNLKKSNKIG